MTTMSDDINTPAGMLRYILRRNEHGVWFVTLDEQHYLPCPRWMWGHLGRACPDVKRAEDGDT